MNGEFSLLGESLLELSIPRDGERVKQIIRLNARGELPLPFYESGWVCYKKQYLHKLNPRVSLETQRRKVAASLFLPDRDFLEALWDGEYA